MKNEAWQKSSLSVAGNCVEVARQDGHVVVRDSKDQNGPTLTFSQQEWTAFVGGVRLGEFDFRS